MQLTRILPRKTLLVCLLATLFSSANQVATVSAQSLRFQRPTESRQAMRQKQVNQRFHSPAPTNDWQSQSRPQRSRTTARPLSEAPRLAKRQAVPQPTARTAVPDEVAQSLRELRQDKPVRRATVRQVQHVPDVAEEKTEEIPAPTNSSGDTEYILEGEQFAGEMYDTSCPGCGAYGGSCGCGYGVEPGCGCPGPDCGGGITGCGSCVGAPGPDYWCFPICLPRFKDLTVWGGVHGFRGPRDFYAAGSTTPGTESDSNFGFQAGFNLSGRAPLIGLLFPQISYQLGYQAVGSRFSGTVNDTSDRGQQFVTAGFFRRSDYGLQYGVVWDLLNDDLFFEEDLHQIRYEISLKSPHGREIGLWATNSTNRVDILGVGYEAVDQYSIFYRWDFGKSSSGRFWGGFTEDSEGLFGGQFITPINNRWSVESVFNYLIPEENAGLEGVSQESWNVGINFVWHLGRTAKRCARSPYRPMFSVANNGWLFVDRAD